MEKFSTTYRVAALCTALLVLAGAALPAGSHAGHILAGQCDKASKKVAVHHSDCTMMQGVTHHNSDNIHKGYHHTKAEHSGDCDPGISCRCSLDDANARKQAVQASVKMAGSLALTGVNIPGQIRKPAVAAVHGFELDALEASPPLYLKHSSFLN